MIEFLLHPSTITADEALQIFRNFGFDNPDELIVIEEGEQPLEVILELLQDEEEGFIEESRYFVISPPMDDYGFLDAPEDLDYAHLLVE